jgi:ribosome maturation factor RimP
MMDPLEAEIEAQIGRQGFELVELERTGSRARPVLRLRIDRPDSSPGHGISVDDCTQVSRALEAFLESEGGVPDRYVLEVSSPGVERPLVKKRDFERFAGREVAVHGRGAIHGAAKRVEGELLGLEDAAGEERIRLRTKDGIELTIPREQTKRVHLVYRWGEEGTGR